MKKKSDLKSLLLISLIAVLFSSCSSNTSSNNSVSTADSSFQSIQLTPAEKSKLGIQATQFIEQAVRRDSVPTKSLVHPAVIQSAGGWSRYVAASKRSTYGGLPMLQGDLDRIKIEFEKPRPLGEPSILKVGQKTFAVISYSIRMKASAPAQGSRKARLNSFLVAERFGSNWKFVDPNHAGTMMTRGKHLHRFLPNFPSQYRLPKQMILAG